MGVTLNQDSSVQGKGVEHGLRGGNPAPWSMFTSPVATLDHLRERPRWLAPLFFTAAYVTAVNHYAVTRFGLERVASAAVRANSGLDPRMVTEAILAHKERILWMHAASAFAGSIVVALIAALFLWLLILAAGGESTFRRVLSVVVHVGLLVAVVEYTMLAIVVTLDRTPNTLNPRNLLATNPAFFIRPNSGAVYRLLSSMDVVSFARLALLSAGLRRVSAGISRFAARLVVFVPWCVYVAAGAVIPWLP